MSGAVLATKTHVRPVAAIRARFDQPKPTSMPPAFRMPATAEAAAPESRAVVEQAAESYAVRAHATAPAGNWPLAVELVER